MFQVARIAYFQQNNCLLANMRFSKFFANVFIFRHIPKNEIA